MSGGGSIKLETVARNGKEYRYYCARFYDETHVQRKRRFPGTKDGEREAKAFLDEVNQKKKAGVMTASAPALSSWVESFLATYKANNVRASSFERLIESYKKILLADFAALPLDKVTGVQIQAFYNKLATDWTDSSGTEHKALSSSSIKKVDNVLRAAYKMAMRQRMLSYNIMDAVEPVRLRTKGMSTFSRREIGAVFLALRKIKANKHNSKQRHNYHLLFRMLLETGCRVGEVLALQWSDIDFKLREIHVHASVGKTGQINAPKTKSGERKIPMLFSGLVSELKEHRDKGNVIQLHGYIFANRNGKPISYRRVLDCWQRVQQLTGIEKNIHTFRHTAATFLLSQGEPVQEVARIMGHSDASITYKVYCHSIAGYNQQMIKRFQERAKRANKSKNKSKKAAK
jgi:integrase